MLFNLLLNDLLKTKNKLVGKCSKTLDRLFSLYFQTMILSNRLRKPCPLFFIYSLIPDYANSQRQRHPIRNDPYGQRPPIQTNPHVYGVGNTQQGNIRTCIRTHQMRAILHLYKQSEPPRPIPRNSVESNHGCISKIYFDNADDNVTLTL